LTPEASTETRQETATAPDAGTTNSTADFLQAQRQTFVESPKARALARSTEDPKQRLQPSSHWTQLWLGRDGFVSEVGKAPVKVRSFNRYEEFGVENHRDYVCAGNNANPAIVRQTQTLANVLRQMRDEVIAINKIIPEETWRVNLVVVAEQGGGSRFSFFENKGFVTVDKRLLPRTRKEQDQVDPSLQAQEEHIDATAHEAAHAVFEYYLDKCRRWLKRSPRGDASRLSADTFALHIVDLFNWAAGTRRVAVPTARFDPAKLPSVLEERSGMPAGQVMVMDRLWSGSGGHPWGSAAADEFFASAFAGWRRRPDLLKQIIEHYGSIDEEVSSLGAELLRVVAGTTKPKGRRIVRDKERATKALQQIPTPDHVEARDRTNLNQALRPALLEGPVRRSSIDCRGYVPPPLREPEDWLEQLKTEQTP
jgi:hypothetical protein